MGSCEFGTNGVRVDREECSRSKRKAVCYVEDSCNSKSKGVLHFEQRWGGGSSNGQESGICKGDVVKNLGDVVRRRKANRKRQTNINCRVEAYGRVINSFDDLRKQWVMDMGFGGLLHVVGMTLPRTFCYWLMTRVDPYKETITFNDGMQYSLTPNQVRWVLGLPNGGKVVPCNAATEEIRSRVKAIKTMYGLERKGRVTKSGKLICSNAVTVTDAIVESLKGKWFQEDECEFKLLFLMVSLYMILCPTQSRSLEADLVPALTCATNASEYDWCSLMLQKLMCSVKRFAKRFDVAGFAGGCGGCALFVAIYYLDRLDRKPLCWSVWPRVVVWNADELRKASREDRICDGGDFGRLQSLKASYGESHPLDGGDKVAPPTYSSAACQLSKVVVRGLKCRGRRSIC